VIPVPTLNASEDISLDSDTPPDTTYSVVQCKQVEEIERLEQALQDAPEHERAYILDSLQRLKKIKDKNNNEILG